MTEKINSNFSINEESVSASKSVSGCAKHCHISELSLSELVKRIREQIEIWAFDDSDKSMAAEIVLIMAEVSKLPASAPVRIDGVKIPAETVAEVYTHIEHEHVLYVIDNCARVTYDIKHWKTYLRTALYNSVFELTARIHNQVKVDMARRYEE